MIGMVVGEEHAVEPADPDVEQLLAKVRRGVDQHIGRGPSPPSFCTSTEQRRRRFFGFDGSHAPQMLPTRGTPPDVPQPRMVSLRVMKRGMDTAERGTFLNRRKKFSVVALRHLGLAHPAQGSKPRRGMHHIGRLVGAPAQGLRRKIRRIGLDQQPVERHLSGDVAQALPSS